MKKMEKEALKSPISACMHLALKRHQFTLMRPAGEKLQTGDE
jgi:hypothetical protein